MENALQGGITGPTPNAYMPGAGSLRPSIDGIRAAGLASAPSGAVSTRGPASELEREGAMLNSETSMLQSLIQDLHQRMLPILRETEPMNDEMEKQPPTNTKHGSFLRSQATNVRQVNQAIRSILHRLEV